VVTYRRCNSGQRRTSDGLTVSFNYTYSRTKDTLAARTGYNFDQDWAVGVNDQPHVWNAMVVYNLPFGSAGHPGSENAVIRAIVRDWQISGLTQFRSGRPLGVIGAACNLPNAGTCYADFNPNFSGPVRINGDYGDGDVLGSTPPSYIDRTRSVPAAFTYGNTPRTWRTTSATELPIRTSAFAGTSGSRGRGWCLAWTSSICSTTWCSAASRPTSRMRTSGASARRPTHRASGS
jgi:hypothetical protein